MANVKQLEEQLRRLQETMARHGIVDVPPAAVDVTERADYVPHSSAAHAGFLGLVVLDAEGVKGAEEDGLHTYTSPRTGTTYRLEDQITPFMAYPDPSQMAQLTLRQKVNELELSPEVPEDAPPLQRPMQVS